MQYVPGSTDVVNMRISLESLSGVISQTPYHLLDCLTEEEVRKEVLLRLRLIEERYESVLCSSIFSSHKA